MQTLLTNNFQPSSDQQIGNPMIVTSAKLASNAVVNSHLASNIVTSAKIAEGGITSAKLANPLYYAPGALSKFGYHTNDCNNDETFVKMATIAGIGYGLCSSIIEENDKTWFQANSLCREQGKRLPDFNEWYNELCSNDPSNSLDEVEWASSRVFMTSFEEDTYCEAEKCLYSVASERCEFYNRSTTFYRRVEQFAAFRCVR